MTVVFTAVSHRFLLMATDSAVQLDFGETREYETGRKFWWIPGVGGVSTWGARDANHIARFLSTKWQDPGVRSIDELARDVHAFLVSEYAPDRLTLGDVGYHIAGFRSDQTPVLYHSFWNTPKDEESKGTYSLQLLAPTGSYTQFLYNGREEFAEHVMAGLLNDLRARRDTHFTHRTAGGAVYLASLVLRFASEISLEVGPPFIMRLMTPTGDDMLFRFNDLMPPGLADLEQRCSRLAIAPWVPPAAAT
jgi:hypothetical protein